MKKICTVVGARPQFIKVAPVSRFLGEYAQEILIHTGQHYDNNMSEVFFSQLGLPKPAYNLEVGSGGHGAQTGDMLKGLEEVFNKERPDAVLVYGDTNSTLAGALAASKLHLPIIHVEAGLRSFNRRMPEEINRVLTDHISTLLFTPTQTAVTNLSNEGISEGVHLVGDVMYDAVVQNVHLANKNSTVVHDNGLVPNEYVLATIHRAENTDNPQRLLEIWEGIQSIPMPIVLPLHPRTRNIIRNMGLEVKSSNLIIIEPVGYFDMLHLEANANAILTDSGGVQKEAYFLKKPCLTVREETEWVETIELGWNTLVEASKDDIVNKFYALNQVKQLEHKPVYGSGDAGEKISVIIKSLL